MIHVGGAEQDLFEHLSFEEFRLAMATAWIAETEHQVSIECAIRCTGGDVARKPLTTGASARTMGLGLACARGVRLIVPIAEQFVARGPREAEDVARPVIVQKLRRGTDRVREAISIAVHEEDPVPLYRCKGGSVGLRTKKFFNC